MGAMRHGPNLFIYVALFCGFHGLFFWVYFLGFEWVYLGFLDCLWVAFLGILRELFLVFHFKNLLDLLWGFLDEKMIKEMGKDLRSEKIRYLQSTSSCCWLACHLPFSPSV